MFAGGNTFPDGGTHILGNVFRGNIFTRKCVPGGTHFRGEHISLTPAQSSMADYVMNGRKRLTGRITSSVLELF